MPGYWGSVVTGYGQTLVDGLGSYPPNPTAASRGARGRLWGSGHEYAAMTVLERTKAAAPGGTAVGLAMTLGVTIGAAGSTAWAWSGLMGQWGLDHGFFVAAAERWLGSGAFYWPHQMAPYEAANGLDVLYPPIALYLFVPFVWLPAILWWVIPLGILGWHVVRARPAWWAWPILALLLLNPRSQAILVWGNTTMWLPAFVALGLRFAWASPFVLLKPTFLPLALIGIRRRAWWAGMAVFCLASLTLLPLWFDYITAIRNNVGPWPGLWYSLPDYPLVLIPVVAWWARR